MGPMVSPALYPVTCGTAWESGLCKNSVGLGEERSKLESPLLWKREGRDSRGGSGPAPASGGLCRPLWLLRTPPSCLPLVLQVTHHGQVLGLLFPPRALGKGNHTGRTCLAD